MSSAQNFIIHIITKTHEPERLLLLLHAQYIAKVHECDQAHLSQRRNEQTGGETAPPQGIGIA
ncbi:hypothetical protein DP73_03100 [Desulfosporosinus sp. HMP52]|nr:hypothetical protein DP73_03100 [Desulfosporosinus sp. HMP52]